MKGIVAYVIGASGLVGRHLVERLLLDKDYSEVRVGVRRGLGFTHPKLVEEIVDFTHIEGVSLIGVDAVFCCLGTTIKQAGSQEAFKTVDLEYPWSFAQLSERDGVRFYGVVTALGSDPQSSVFYSRVKGTLEQRLKGLESLTVVVFRPSMLLGDRTDFRFVERVGGFLMELLRPIMVGSVARYRAIQASVVAESMLRVSKIQKGGFRIVESEEMEMIAG